MCAHGIVCYRSAVVILSTSTSLASRWVAKSSISFGWGKGGKFTTAGWQVTLSASEVFLRSRYINFLIIIIIINTV